MSVTFTIDRASAIAPFEQLRVQVADAAGSGALAAGAALPTVRALAAELGLAANTVAKAYRALESDGVIETRGRAGTVVATRGDASARRAQDAANEFARVIRRLGVPRDDALEYVRRALDS